MAKKGSGVKFTTPPLAELKKICSPQYFHCFSKLISHLQSQSQQDPHLPQPAPPLSAAAWEKLTTAGKLVYSGAYLYERLTILPTHRPTEWLSELKPHFDPSVFTLLSSAAQNSLQYTPEQIFRDLHFVVGVTQWARKVVFEDGEVMVLLPSAPGHPKVLEVEGNPVEVGEWLGSLMGWANVLGCEAVGLVGGWYQIAGEEEDMGAISMPFGVVLIGLEGLLGVVDGTMNSGHEWKWVEMVGGLRYGMLEGSD